MELKKPESLNKQEIDFCELFIFGCDPYAGNARKCYEDIFYDSSHTSLRKAKQLMARDDVQEYINQLRAILVLSVYHPQTMSISSDKMINRYDDSGSSLSAFHFPFSVQPVHIPFLPPNI